MATFITSRIGKCHFICNMSRSEDAKFRKLIEQEEHCDRKKRKKELSKRNRKQDTEAGSGKSGYKKTTHKFDSIS